ncbi:hypothetical protein DL89DRAFT_258251 [Linderina pennispora]|uniref:Uncharacterized protein n=1 Tax=Linderina pennispora TaxID=61395 RepID=A0A1Y1W7P5_9FUNG|nr:uncharacterized protein DL89DRAFT_258251 [Linderina pennispora]ORX69194.1 hypothetical protein DL89DRAFT_258251 [Linderina pennispora]
MPVCAACSCSCSCNDTFGPRLLGMTKACSSDRWSKSQSSADPALEFCADFPALPHSARSRLSGRPLSARLHPPLPRPSYSATASAQGSVVRSATLIYRLLLAAVHAYQSGKRDVACHTLVLAQFGFHLALIRYPETHSSDRSTGTSALIKCQQSCSAIVQHSGRRPMTRRAIVELAFDALGRTKPPCLLAQFWLAIASWSRFYRSQSILVTVLPAHSVEMYRSWYTGERVYGCWQSPMRQLTEPSEEKAKSTAGCYRHAQSLGATSQAALPPFRLDSCTGVFAAYHRLVSCVPNLSFGSSSSRSHVDRCRGHDENYLGRAP